MAIFRRKVQPETEHTPPPRAVLAAAVPLTGPEAVRGLSLKQSTEQWQKDAWYFFDAVGELRSAVTWIANAVSKADIFGAEVDLQTGLVTGPTEDARAQAAAALCLGGAGKRAQLQHVLAVCWQVPGEAYVVVRGRPGGRQDEWLVLSGDRVKPRGRVWTYQDPVTLSWIELGVSDRMLRVWSPHPNDQSKADTAVRPALPVLREIEKTSMNLSSVLDSRIATAGIHAIPSELDMPLSKGSGSVAEEVSSMYMRAASAGLSNPGTAAAQVPVIFPMPAEYIPAFVEGRMHPETSMDATVLELRKDDLTRLASMLDMPNETAEGSNAGMNHWGAWQVEETTYKIFIEPLLDRVGDALTELWYRPVLSAMGVQDPERYTLAWDTTGIVARPDATEDMNWLYDQGLISDEYRRQASGVPDDAAPDEDESQLRRLERIVLADPSLMSDPQVAELLVGFALEAPEPAGSGSAPAIPDQRADENTSAVTGPPPAGVPEAGEVPDGLVAAAELVVFDALSRAGGRLLTREHRGQFSGTPKHELHAVISSRRPAAELLADSFQFSDRVADSFSVDRGRLGEALHAYTRARLETGQLHSRGDMVKYLRAAL
jgi:hypothetical protein